MNILLQIFVTSAGVLLSSVTYVIPDTYNDVQHWEFPLFGLKMLRLLHVLARDSRQIVFSVQCGAFWQFWTARV